MQISNNDRRITFDVAKRLLEKYGIKPEQANPAYGYLRLEAPLVDGTTQVRFPLLQQQSFNNTPIANTEQRLALQDTFVVGSKGVFLYFYDTVEKIPKTPLLTGLTPYNAPAGYTYGLLQPIWTTGALQAFDASSNELWMSGWMRYTADYQVLIPYYDLLQHYFVPQSQATPATTSSNNLDPTADPYYGFAWNIPQQDGLSDGFMPMEPNIVLSGAKNTEIVLNFPNPYIFDNIGWDATNILNGRIQPRVVCLYRGVLLQNTTNVK